MQPDRELIERFAEAGGAGKPVVGGLKVCFDHDRERAVRTAREVAVFAARARVPPAVSSCRR